MSRGIKIFLITHLYPVYLVLHMKYADWCTMCTFIFNVTPIFFVSLLLQIWISTSAVKLTYPERLNLWLFIYFFAIVHIYYGICALIMNSVSGAYWIKEHNSYFTYFIIFMFTFYLVCRARKRRS